MASEMRMDPEIQAIGSKLIAEYHRHLLDNGTRILYVHSDQDKAYRGKAVPADTIALGSAQYRLGLLAAGQSPDASEDYEFAIIVYGSLWEGMTPYQREAAIDAELCKLIQKTVQRAEGETTVIKLQDYDVKGFAANVERYGLWRTNLKLFASKVKQLSFDMQNIQFDEAAEAQQAADASAQVDGTGEDGEKDETTVNEGDDSAVARLQREGHRRRADGNLAVVGA